MAKAGNVYVNTKTGELKGGIPSAWIDPYDWVLANGTFQGYIYKDGKLVGPSTSASSLLGVSTPSGERVELPQGPGTEGPAPDGTAPSAGTNGTPAPTDAGGPYEAFNAAFQAAFGRPITQEEQSSNEFVETLSNEIFRLLPKDRLIGFSLDRLGKLSNDDLISLVPSVIPLFSNERLASFSQDYLDKAIQSRDRRKGLGLGVFTGGEDKPAPVRGPITPLDPSQIPGRAFTPQFGEGTAQELLGGFKGVDMPELDIKRLFPFVGSTGVAADPGMASANLMESAGIRAGRGNPFASFLESNIPQFANIARVQDILRGGKGADPDIMHQAPRILGGGITGATGQGLIGDLARMARQFRSDPRQLTTEQSSYAEGNLTDPENVLSTLSEFQDVAPDLRRSQSRVNQELLRRFRNVTGPTPNLTMWDWLRM